jgi:hypothetical protein
VATVARDVEDTALAIRRALTPFERNCLVIVARARSDGDLEQAARDLCLPGHPGARGEPRVPPRHVSVEDLEAGYVRAVEKLRQLAASSEGRKPARPEAELEPGLGPNGRRLCVECREREVPPREPGKPGQPRTRCLVCRPRQPRG